ncbi:unnamed protein product [Adineta ricciae]|uniref:Uncharacterized protein n=1 Tax=Adineta ricciae TaxID=249248 RepID=A0A814VL59_ADIRI|nr:unnamed protein product [Adineta ricciae]
MNRLRTAPGEESQQLVSSQQTSKMANEIGDDDIFLDDESNDDHQAHIRRRAPTRHSIKSLSGRKTTSKQTTTTGTTTTSAATTTEVRYRASIDSSFHLISSRFVSRFNVKLFHQVSCVR